MLELDFNNTPAVTTLYAVPLALLIVALAARVVWLRNADRVGLGHGESKRLGRAIRIHANAVEYVPLALLLMLLFELNGGAPWLLHACGLTLLTGRVLHVWGLSRSGGYSLGRYAGTTMTWLAIVALAGANLGLIL